MRRTSMSGAFVSACLAVAVYSWHRTGSVAGAIMLGLLAGAALVAGLSEWRRVNMSKVRVSLDASRRWVTLSGVHPDFAGAIQDRVDRADLGSAQHP
jgi:hypothetical protein